MNISRYTLLVLVIAGIFFLAPFFWFKPGEMDLGGDSSRLYFYDPLHYLTSQALYSVSHSGLGGEGINYFGIPFFLLLAGLKSILKSPTILIAFVHGFSLSLAFLSCYLIVKQLLFQDEEKRTPLTILTVEITALLAGLYYVSAPVSILIWNHMLLSDNQIFLNPLIFLLLLRYVLTRNMLYLLVVLLITFLFAPNFSVVGAPAFFAFYPLSILFLVLYARYVVHKPLPIRDILIGVVLFFLLHAFHLLPVIVSLLTPGSPGNQLVFSQEAKIDGGLGYFNAIVPGIKPSISFLGLQHQISLNFFSFTFFIFPILFVLGFLWNRKKSMLLTGIFFLITFFFYTANITTIGLNFYRLLFHIPGFSMFRVFFGQWMWVYLFFYTLLFGQALFVVLTRIKKWQGISLVFFLTGFLMIIAWPFVSGKTLQYVHWQTKNVSAIVAMDPKYDEVLSYLRSLPVDGKILSLPLSDPGYQAIKGKNNAAYEGPSTITYLAGRNEFMGFVEFESFGPSFIKAAKEKNYPAIRDILSILNIKYIYYNEDPYIYGDNFPGQPYIQVRNFLPDTQEGYKEFIKELGVKEIKTIGSKYHIYELDDATYLPHIYAAGRIVYVSGSKSIEDTLMPLSFHKKEDNRFALFVDTKSLTIDKNLSSDSFSIASIKTNTIFDVQKSLYISSSVPQELYFSIYPLVIANQKRNIGSKNQSSKLFFNKQIIDFMQGRNITVTYDTNNDLEKTMYEIFVQKENGLEKNNNFYPKMIINDNDIPLSTNQTEKMWSKFDYFNSNLFSKPFLIISLPSGEVPLEIKKWGPYMGKETKYVDFTIDGFMLSLVSDLINKYGDWSPNSLYFMSFDFLDKQNGQVIPTWKTYKTIVETGKDIKPVFMRVLFDENNPWTIVNFTGPETIDIKNFSLIHLTYPKVFIKHTSMSQDSKSLPTITFKKINPTRYKVYVQNAKNPYILVFLQTFNKNWEIIDQSRLSPGVVAATSRIFGDMASTILSFFNKKSINNDTKEVSVETFANQETFMSLGKNSVAQDKHYVVDGYANAWYIEPKDFDSKTSYTFVIEMTSQRLFYYLLFISFIVFGCCVVGFGVLGYKNMFKETISNGK